MTTQRELAAEAAHLARLLLRENLQIAFAESCTGGLMSAVLTRIPGISENFCGSAVVYQFETKTAWLGISEEILAKPGPVSRVVAIEMARGVLDKTPHANLAVSVTGHLGPNAPKRQDGLIWFAAVARDSSIWKHPNRIVVRSHRFSPDDRCTPAQLRIRRQRAAARHVLRAVAGLLERNNS